MIAGAGNPTGSFTGPAEQLEYIGNHVYAYSGGVPVPNSNTNLLKFTSGSHYIKVEILFTARASTSDDYRAFVGFNGKEVFGAYYVNSPQAYPYGSYPVRLIIPPYTEVEVYMINVSTSADYTWFALLTGRVYRG